MPHVRYELHELDRSLKAHLSGYEWLDEVRRSGTEMPYHGNCHTLILDGLSVVAHRP
jgi:hypothetical protein